MKLTCAHIVSILAISSSCWTTNAAPTSLTSSRSRRAKAATSISRRTKTSVHNTRAPTLSPSALVTSPPSPEEKEDSEDSTRTETFPPTPTQSIIDTDEPDEPVATLAPSIQEEEGEDGSDFEVLDTGTPTSFPTTSQPTRNPTGTAMPSLITTESAFLPTAVPTSSSSSEPSEPTILLETEEESVAPTTTAPETITDPPTFAPDEVTATPNATVPTNLPTAQPTTQPTSQPSGLSTTNTTASPTMQTSGLSTTLTTSSPTMQTSAPPTTQSTELPTSQPSGLVTTPTTAQPSGLATALTTEQPTSQPTSSPTALPTTQSTAQPTAPRVLVPVAGRVDLELRTTPALLTGAAERAFLEATQEFLGRHFLGATSTALSSNEKPLLVTNVVVQLLFQSRNVARNRKLQNAASDPQQLGLLSVDLMVLGRSATNDAAATEEQFVRALKDVFLSDADEYINYVKAYAATFPDASPESPTSASAYFDSLQQVVILPTTPGNPDAVKPTSAPTQIAPTTPDAIKQDDQPSSDESPFTVGVLLGIAFTIVALILVIVLVCMYCSGKKKNNGSKRLTERDEAKDGIIAGTDSYDNIPQQKGRTTLGGRRQAKSPTKKSQNPPFFTPYNLEPINGDENEGEGEKQNSDVESHGYYSYDGFTNGGGTVGGGTLNGNGDTMSYAYSLDNGLEPSLVSGLNEDDVFGVQTTDSELEDLVNGINAYDAERDDEDDKQRLLSTGLSPDPSGVEVTSSQHRNANELSTSGNVTVRVSEGGGSNRSRQNRSNPPVPTDIGGPSSEIIEATDSGESLSVASDMVDLNNVTNLNNNLQSAHRNVSSTAISPKSGAAKSSRKTWVKRLVPAPPGKLGIIIDTTIQGPLIHEVHPKSKLKGSLWPGDIIIGIDHVDTRAMSATDITTLMVDTAHKSRRLTILSESAKFYKTKPNSSGKQPATK